MNFQQQLLLVAMLTLSCVHSDPPIAVKTKLKRDVFLPYCTSKSIVYGESQTSSTHVLRYELKFPLGLHKTLCTIWHGSSNSFLYTVGLSAVEQHYPVTQHYQFAVPLIKLSCKCDCAGGDEDHCSPAEYSHSDCKSSQSSLSCRSYHPNQAFTGCPLSETSELCCDTSFAPYKDWRFSALKIEEPQTFANFTYRAYVWSRGDWKIAEEDEIRMQLNDSIQMVELSKVTKTHVEVLGTVHPHKLESGMYFMRDGEDELRFDVDVNPLNGSRPDELGWFRLGNDGEYHVQNETLEMNNLHSVTVLDCKEQKYKSSFNKIGHYVTSGIDGDRENFNLGRIVSDSNPWINKSFLKPEIETETQARTVVILRDSDSIEVKISFTKNGENLLFVYNTSVLTSFTGSIILDNTSNRFLVLNFTDSVGTVRGSCYVNESKKTNELSFRVYVSSNNLSDASTIVRLPSSINSSRYICLETDNSNQGETCKWLDYNSEPLTYNLSNIFWQEDTGHSTGCNKFTTFCDAPVKNLPSNLLIKVGLLVIVFVAVISIITMIAVISVKKKKFFYGVIPSTSP
uniref:Uncharacterized protein n=1 Tax=Plectus sambesii TaxID=2011161 RepID=A0A914WWC0_9BILA